MRRIVSGVVALLLLLGLALAPQPALAANGDARLRIIEAFDPNYATVCQKIVTLPHCDGDLTDVFYEYGSTKPYTIEAYRADYGALTAAYIDLHLDNLSGVTATSYGYQWTGSGTTPSCSWNATDRRYSCTASAGNLLGIIVLFYATTQNGPGQISVTSSTYGTKTTDFYQTMCCP